jgi:predicted DNA binding CopG/RHH family protein
MLDLYIHIVYTLKMSSCKINGPKGNKTYTLDEMSFGPDTGENLVFDPKDAKVMISIRVDGDVLKAFKDQAKASGKKYQAIMNDVLRAAVTDERRPHKPLTDVSQWRASEGALTFDSEVRSVIQGIARKTFKEEFESKLKAKRTVARRKKKKTT